MSSWKQRLAARTAARVGGSTAAPTVGLEVGPLRRRVRIDWQKVVGGGRGLLLAVVVLAPEAAAWQGLLALGRDEFHMHGGWEYLVPLLFGAAAFYVALLAQRYVLRGDSAITERALTWIYAAGGAGFNWWHVEATGGETAAALFFGGASLSSALLWDRTLRAWRRDQLREIGALERPLPRFRALRWALAPGDTFAAFRVSVLHGLSTADEALALVDQQRKAARAAELVDHQQRKAKPAEPMAANEAASAPSESVEQPPQGIDERPVALAATDGSPAETDTDEVPAAEAAAELPAVDEHRRLVEIGGRSKADAVREAWRLLGVADLPTLRHVQPAVELLAGAGIPVDPKYVREVRLRDMKAAAATQRPARPALRVAGE